jgi:hypothetical protein
LASASDGDAARFAFGFCPKLKLGTFERAA